MAKVGYAFDADICCVDCTLKWAGTIPETQYEFGNDKYPEDYQDADGVFQVDELIEDGIIVDSEGNMVHAVFDTEETDYPQHCADCGEYIDSSWTQECQNYVVEAFGRYIEGYIYPDSGEGGDPDVLAVWAEHADGSNAKDVFEYIQSVNYLT